MADPLARLTSALADRYRIERELGAGGMATVYLADDLKHDRKVAIKVLKPELAAVIGGERFVAEIKTTAALQHPHILPLFDSGEADGFLYYVMPYVEGESLRDRLDREKQLPVDEAVAIAVKVAGALHAAHVRSVIHRDIKPANILLAPGGEPLVADFGIALAVSAAGAGRLTETGLSLGTPHYMSPEQATADRDPDARSDVYALGCVLYEMLTGDPPYTASTVRGVVARILTDDPRPLTEIRRSVPTNVEAAVLTALEKTPADRPGSAAEFAAAVQDPAYRRPAAAVGSGVGARGAIGSKGWDTRSRILAGSTALLTLLVAWLSWPGDPGPPPSPGLFLSEVVVPPDPTDTDVHVGPDNTLATSNGNRIHVRRPGMADFEPLEHRPFTWFDHLDFSPDGREIVYAASGDIAERGFYRIPVSGGPPISIIRGRTSTSPLWAEDGFVYGVFGWLSTETVVGRVPDNAGTIDSLLAVTADQSAIPQAVSPDGGVLLLTLEAPGDPDAPDRRLLALDLATRDTVTVLRDVVRARFTGDGHLVFLRGGSPGIFGARFDAREMSLASQPVLVVPDAHRFDVGLSGLLVHASVRLEDDDGIVHTLVGRDGSVEPVLLDPVDHSDARLSPDGRRMAYIDGTELRVFDLDLGSDRVLADGLSSPHNPVWSPEGDRIAFHAAHAGADTLFGLFRLPADGSEPPGMETFWGRTYPLINLERWLPDGTMVGEGSGDILRTTPDGGVEPVLEAAWTERRPSISPNGRWLAYLSDEGGVWRAYVRRWPSLERQVQVSSADEVPHTSRFRATALAWSAGSDTLFYQVGGGLPGGPIVAAHLEPEGDSLRVVDRLELGALGVGSSRLQGMHPDGRFMFMREAGTGVEGAARWIAVTGFSTEVRRRLEEANR